MKPSVMLLGFLLGSCGAVSFGLLGVAFIFWLIGPEHPELKAEVGPLITHLLRFLGLTVASAVSFYGLVRQTWWRRYSVGALVMVLGAVIAAYSLA
jgi:hypothetical protein